MDDYPVKEITLQKIYTTTILIRANSDKEAENKVYGLAKQGKFEDKFIYEPYYDTEQSNAYKEGHINESVIYKE